MKKICEKCGREYICYPGFSSARRKYCNRCDKKSNIQTQDQLAKRCGHEIMDNVTWDANAASAAGEHYGDWMVHK